MGFSLNFKNIGHYFATGFKYVAIGVRDILMVADKAKTLQPEVEALVTALAGPAGAKIADMAFNVLGSVAVAVQAVGTDAAAQQTAVGLNLTLDTQLVNDIKAAALQIENIIKAVGGTKPTK